MLWKRNDTVQSTFAIFRPGWWVAQACVAAGAFYLGHRYWRRRDEEEM